MKITAIRPVQNPAEQACRLARYNPFYTEYGETEMLFNQGGDSQFPPGAPPLGDWTRFGDTIWLSTRTKGTKVWSPYEQAITSRIFPWNAAGPNSSLSLQSRIGSIGAFRMVRDGDRWKAYFTVSFRDPNLATGEHPKGSNQYGLTDDPWSEFCIMSATSYEDVPRHWYLENYQNQHANIALQYALAYYEATPEEQSGNYKGTYGLAGAIPDYKDGSVSLWVEFWRTSGWRGTGGQVQFVLRCDHGVNKYEVWTGNEWLAFTNGSLPKIVNAEDELTFKDPSGDPAKDGHWSFINPATDIASHVVDCGSRFTAGRYALFAAQSGSAFGGTGDVNCIAWQLSDSLTGGWKAQGLVGTPIQHVFDGTGQSVTVFDPFLALPRDGAPRIYLGTNDLDLDGKQDCAAFSPYVGVGIVECDTDIVAAQPPVVVPPPNVDPGSPPPAVPPDPQPVTLPFGYTSPHPLPIDETKLIRANGYGLGDTFYVSLTVWAIFQGAGAPLFPPPDGGQWVKKGTVA